MTQKEFEEMTGFDFQLDAEQYRCIEEVYMTVDDDKLYFCELLKVMYEADRCTMEFMLSLGRKMIEQKKKLLKEIHRMKSEMDDIEEFLYEQVGDPDEYAIKDKCMALYGKGEFLAKCIEDDKDLSCSDVDFIADLLRSKDNQ